ncbi:unnamed protein product, partial [Didymodactylos carnosus]
MQTNIRALRQQRQQRQQEIREARQQRREEQQQRKQEIREERQQRERDIREEQQQRERDIREERQQRREEQQQHEQEIREEQQQREREIQEERQQRREEQQQHEQEIREEQQQRKQEIREERQQREQEVWKGRQQLRHETRRIDPQPELEQTLKLFEAPRRVEPETVFFQSARQKQPSAKCPLLLLTCEWLQSVNWPPSLFNSAFDRCYCKHCYPAHWNDVELVAGCKVRRMKKADNTNVFKKFSDKLEKFEQNLITHPSAVPFSNVFQSPSTSSLTQLPHSHSETVLYNQQYSDTHTNDDLVSLQNYSYDNNNQNNDPTILVRPQSDSSFQSATTTGTFYPEEIPEKPWKPIASDHPSQDVQSDDNIINFDAKMKKKCLALMKDKEVSLSDIKHYDAKESLLRQALSINVPSVTVPIIMFLENTLSQSLFCDLISQYPSVISTYLNICKLCSDTDDYVKMLKRFGQLDELALAQFRLAGQTTDLPAKFRFLDEAIDKLTSNYWWQTQVFDYRRLLEKQQTLHIATTTTLFKTFRSCYDTEFRRNDKNVSNNVIWDLCVSLSPELTMYAKLSVIISHGLRTYYQEFVSTALPQGLSRHKYIISPHVLVDMVYKASIDSGERELASERTKKFLLLITNPEKRLTYAEKYGNYDVAIDTIVNNLKDRSKLENLRKRMPKDHYAIIRATTLLE